MTADPPTAPEPTAPEPTAPEPTAARGRRGPLRDGERVLLTDPKGRRHLVTLQAGREWHSHRGGLALDDLIGSPEGVVVEAGSGTSYLVVRPLLTDTVTKMGRAATVMYPKDLGAVVVAADVFPGATVVEAGAGSGSLTCALLRAVGDEGRVVSFEVRDDHAAVARRNVEAFFGGEHPAWSLHIADLAEGLPGQVDDGTVDRVVLDMLAPWDVLDAVSAALAPGGVLVVYVTTTTQLSRVVEELRAHGTFTEPSAGETLERGWHVEGLAVRPQHRMNGHTGFLVTTRRLAPGTAPPPRRRRPAPGTSLGWREQAAAAQERSSQLWAGESPA